MSWILKLVPIDLVFLFLNNFVLSTIKNPGSIAAQNLKPLIKELNSLTGQLLEKLG